MIDKFYVQQRETILLFSYATHVFNAMLSPNHILFSANTFLPSDISNMIKDIQGKYVEIWRRIFEKDNSLFYSDQRFSNNLWKEIYYFQYLHQVYLLFSDFIDRYKEILFFNYRLSDVQNYWLSEWIAIINPANYFFTNPVAISEYIKTSGKTLSRGFELFLQDMCYSDIGRVPRGHFKVGHNLATTPGKVILKTDLYELIFYNHSRVSIENQPIVIFPPCINRFYILDLQEENSLVRFCVSRDYPVFMLSWRSINPDNAHYTMKEYVQALIDCIAFIREITGYDKIHVLGYCIAGFFLYIALMVMSLQKRDWVCGATLLVSTTNSEYPGILSSFVQKETIETINRRSKIDPLIHGHELSWLFASIRSEDLIWSYVRRRYLLGEESDPWDILAWNADHANIPARMFTEYLDLLYVQNVLINSNGFFWNDYYLNSKTISCPLYVVSCLRDHIVPWGSVYFGLFAFTNADIRFVLSSAGHVVGIISPPDDSSRFYYAEDYSFTRSEHEILSCPKFHGSWWLDWSEWLNRTCACKVRDYTDCYSYLSEAPGTYVFESSRGKRKKGA